MSPQEHGGRGHHKWNRAVVVSAAINYVPLNVRLNLQLNVKHRYRDEPTKANRIFFAFILDLARLF